MKPMLRLALVLFATLAAVSFGTWSAQRWLGERATPLAATVLVPPRPLPAFELVDHHGIPFEPSRLTNRWSLMFFGFTNCPDICPLTLRSLAEAQRLLNERGESAPRVIFVSVDPGRDSVERLAEYLPHFDREFLGVTGTPPAIEALTRALGIAVAISSDPRQPDRYSVDHTAALFLIDPQGRLRALFSTPHEARRIADDYAAITAG